MHTIYYSNKVVISYGDHEVRINDIPIHAMSNQGFDEYAIQEMRAHYHEILTRDFDNLIILTGSGISSSSGGMTSKELWHVLVEIFGIEHLSTLADAINYKAFNPEYTDIEEFLYHGHLALKFNDSKVLRDNIHLLKKAIVKRLDIQLNNSTVFENFIEKCCERSVEKSRVKIFTLNIDTLIEQAASRLKYLYIDGFSYTQPRIFDGMYFDYDFVKRKSKDFAKRVFHLYKLHGSIDWGQDDKQVIIQQTCEDPVVMFTKNNDFESAYDHPFFEIISRFQQELRRPNTLLITLGFSFNEQHIADMIKNSLITNESLSLMVVDKNTEQKSFDFFKGIIKYNSNVFLIKDTFEAFVKNYPFFDS